MVWFAHLFVKLTGWLPHVFAFRKKIYYEDKKSQGRRIKGKAIIISNHYTVWDYPLLMFVFIHRTLRCQIAELMYRKNVFMTLLLKALGGVKVDRNSHDFSFINKSTKLLNKNKVLTIFPESRIPRPEEETPLPFKPSAVYLALSSGAPIIPVAVSGKYFGKKRAAVMIGKTIDVREWYQSELSEKENIDYINNKLREKVIELKNELERRTNGKTKKAQEKTGE